MTVIRRTKSVCPVCLKQIPAYKEERGGEIFMEKECPEHGHFSSVVWRNKVDMSGWTGGIAEIKADENINCPAACGLCGEHLRDTCCTLLEVTDRCNLRCRYCFADNHQTDDPPIDTVKAWIKDLTKPGKTLLQLSGGEPTVRDDLPELIAYAKECGCRYIQLNTNGLRLADEPGYTDALKEAGLSFVFLQFDATGDTPWEKLRRRPLADIKERCIENCEKSRLGVTLVPTLVPGVNIGEIGDIIRFGMKHSPTVRGVHFQPVSYMGNTPVPEDKDRFTLDELLAEIEAQMNGVVRIEDLSPSSCDHPLCGFHGDFIVMPDKKTLMPLTKRRELADASGRNPAEMNREFVGRRWERHEEAEGDTGAGTADCCCGMPVPASEEGDCCGAPLQAEGGCCCGTPVDVTSFDGFIKMHRTYGFTITSMAFQDAGNLDIERLRQCSLHVYKDGRIVPFCANYLTPFTVDKR